MTILVHTDSLCATCGDGHAINHLATAKAAKVFMGMLAKNRVAKAMEVSPQYVSDLLSEPPRKAWNAELAGRFEAAVKKLQA